MKTMFKKKEEKKSLKRFQVTQIANTGNLLGESPVWDARCQQLIWVDILGMKVHTYSPAKNSTRTVSTEVQVGCVGLVENQPGTLVAGTREGIGFLNADTGLYTKITDPERHKPANRFNDGKVDPQGRFIVGSMYTLKPRKLGTANLYEFNGIKEKKVPGVGQVTTSNGLGWNKSGDLFYYIDSPSMKVMEYGYGEEGVTEPGRVVVTVSKESGGAPDGLSVDEEGKIWVALFRGGKVVRYDPATFEVLAIVDLPCKHVTSCCFGGANMERLFITTAKGSSLEEIKENTNKVAGALFAVDVGVRGVPIHEFIMPKGQSKL